MCIPCSYHGYPYQERFDACLSPQLPQYHRRPEQVSDRHLWFSIFTWIPCYSNLRFGLVFRKRADHQDTHSKSNGRDKYWNSDGKFEAGPTRFSVLAIIHPSIHPSIYIYIYIYTVYICICCTTGPCFCSCLAPCSPASCKCSPRHPHRSTRQCRRPTNPGTTELLARQALEKCGFPKIGIPPENSSKLSTSYDFHGFSINHPALGVFPLLKPPELILSPAPQLHQGTGKSCWYRTSQSPAATKDRSTA